MRKRIQHRVAKFFRAFPIQLLIHHVQRNHFLLLCWVILFAVVSENVGKHLGVPYLFLDPEYLNQVNFLSFFFIGLSLGFFTIAFHTNSYIADSLRFLFLGTMSAPFAVFTINNSVLPFSFLGFYIYRIASFQLNEQLISYAALIEDIGGLLVGYGVVSLLTAFYFYRTNKDVAQFAVCRLSDKDKIQTTTW